MKEVWIVEDYQGEDFEIYETRELAYDHCLQILADAFYLFVDPVLDEEKKKDYNEWLNELNESYKETSSYGGSFYIDEICCVYPKKVRDKSLERSPRGGYLYD